MSYSFLDRRRGGETAEGVLYTYVISDEETEVLVDRMIDVELAMTPQEGDPEGAYPPICHNNAKLSEHYEQLVISEGLPLAPLYLLPEGSRLRNEWFRRAEILKKERADLQRSKKV